VPGPASNITESLISEILTGYQTSQCRDFINALAGSRRALAHAQIYPGVGNLADPAFGDYTQWQIDFCQPDSWKGYNVAFAASAFPGAEFTRWRLDDEVLAYPTYAVIAANKDQLKKHPGFFNICIHKGLSASGTQPGGPNNLPQFGNPDDLVKVATDWPQFNFIIYHSCIRPSFWVLQALEDIENQPGSMPPTRLMDSHGHSVPNIRWSTQFAQIAGGRYQAGAEPSSTSPSSDHRLRNVYAELGTTMASMIVTFPTVWSHLIGQLLYYMGPDNIVFGSDSLWYGGPQWQIEALWRFQIPEQIREEWNYPPLTPAAKRKILGLNSARLYGLHGATAQPIGKPGSAYRQGKLPDYATYVQPGSAIDTVLQGPGYPTPITPVDLIGVSVHCRAPHDCQQLLAGDLEAMLERVARHPLRGAAGRRPALGAAAAAPALDEHARSNRLRQSMHPVQWPGERGLPVPERVATRGRRSEPAGSGAHPRRRLPRWLRRRQQRQPAGQHGERGGRRDELPAGDLRLPGELRPRTELGRLRPPGPAGRPAMGATEHRGVRRRPAQRDHLRRVRGRLERLRPDRLADGGRPLPTRDLVER
jgi:predicted TIM-barrel fold metal-dependent hydrolase